MKSCSISKPFWNIETAYGARTRKVAIRNNPILNEIVSVLPELLVNFENPSKLIVLGDNCKTYEIKLIKEPLILNYTATIELSQTFVSDIYNTPPSPNYRRVVLKFEL